MIMLIICWFMLCNCCDIVVYTCVHHVCIRCSYDFLWRFQYVPMRFHKDSIRHWTGIGQAFYNHFDIILISLYIFFISFLYHFEFILIIFWSHFGFALCMHFAAFPACRSVPTARSVFSAKHFWSVHSASPPWLCTRLLHHRQEASTNVGCALACWRFEIQNVARNILQTTASTRGAMIRLSATWTCIYHVFIYILIIF